MNPDSYRDAMDRSSNPYYPATHDNLDPMKLTAGLEELSLKKQLPLRQQTTKPTLKYNTSKNQPVHLFNQGHVGMIAREPPGANNYPTAGLYYTGNINGANHILENPLSTAKNTSQQQQQQQQMQQTPTTARRDSNVSNASNISNPYVRPVSATEVAANINGDKARKMVESTIAVVSDKTNDLANSTLQRNSFLRPLSGVDKNKDKHISRKQIQSPRGTPPPPSQLSRKNSFGSDSGSVKQYAESKAIMKSKFQFASTSSSPVPSNVRDNTLNKSNSIATHTNNEASQPTSSKTSTVNPSKAQTYLGHAQSLNGSSSHDTHPYHTHAQSYNVNHVARVPAVDASKPSYVSDGSQSTKDCKDIETPQELSHLKKMPVTNTLTGTLYYRKPSLNDHKSNKTNSLSSKTQSGANLSSLSSKTQSAANLGSSQYNPSNFYQDDPISSSRTEPGQRPLNSHRDRQVTGKPPLQRPSFERSNASIQLNTKALTSDRKLSSSNSSLNSIEDKRLGGGGNKTTLSPVKPPGTARLSSNLEFPGKHAVNGGIKPKTKTGLALSALEQRPKADGAPSKMGKPVEKKKTALAKQPADWANNDGEEDDDDDDDDDGCNDDEEEGSETTPSGERLPGDGEASFDDDFDDDGEDEEDLDNYEPDLSDGDGDGESDSYSINSRNTERRHVNHANGRPMTSQSAGAAEKSDELLGMKGQVRPATASNVPVKPALKTSLFKHIPPTINFVGEGEKTEQLPWELRKLLKWKMSPITPIVVKRAIGRVGFRYSKRNHDWLGCFGKHMKAQCFKSLREYQKLNHFPGSFQIGRKDRLWRNLSRCQVHYGKREFNFFPHTYVLPADLKLLKRAWEDGNAKQKWIIKPPASARGIGIKVISKWSQIPRRKPVIVQKYLAKPYLINDSKFDMRIYVYVSSYDPLRIYVYEDGLARFASIKYSSSMKSLSNRYMHLTNYSINKKNSDYEGNTDNTVCQGHKWSLKALWNFMKKQGHNTTLIWDSIRDLIIKTIICGDSSINSMTKSNSRSRYCCHELFGFDILLDDFMKPWILEVNISPSLHSNSQLDINIKGGMIKDLMNIAGFRIPDERDVSSSPSHADFSGHSPVNKYCMDKRLFTNQLAPDERAKHAYYCQKHQDEQIMQSILDIITPDDMRLLTESIDEDGRKGNFQRLFPTPQTHRYLRYFEQPRYYNLLLDQWVQRYNRMEQRGILLLQSFCEEKIHLENPTSNSRHQWAPPNSTMASMRAADLRPSGPMTSSRGKDPPEATVKEKVMTLDPYKTCWRSPKNSPRNIFLAPGPPLPRVLKKLPGKTPSASSFSSSSTSLAAMSPMTPSPIGPIGSPSSTRSNQKSLKVTSRPSAPPP